MHCIGVLHVGGGDIVGRSCTSNPKKKQSAGSVTNMHVVHKVLDCTLVVFRVESSPRGLSL